MKTLATSSKVLTSLALTLGLSLSAVAPARSASIGSVTASGDNNFYRVDGGSTILDNSYSGSLDSLLAGDASNPGGNIELGANTETQGLGSQGKLSGFLNGQGITLSSLTAADWESDVDGNGRTLGEDWMGDLLRTHAPQTQVDEEEGFNLIRAILSLFFDMGGRERFSDPNVSYVRQDDDQVKIGLAGHYDAQPLLQSVGVNLPISPVQVSEIVKVNYGGETSYHYGLSATLSGVVNDQGVGADSTSHNGNYEVSLDAVQPVPEPSLMVGTLAALGLGAALKRRQAQA